MPMNKGTSLSLLSGALLLLLSASPAFAQEKTTIGGACTTGQAAADWDTIMQCVSSVWKRAAIWVGSSADTCDASHAGIIQWTGSAMQYCNGTAWTAIGSTTNSLGSAATTTNPQRSGDATTGLYSDAASTVSIATAGTQRMTIGSTGNVGIGTTSASQRLHVLGPANSYTSYFSDGTVTTGIYNGLNGAGQTAGFFGTQSAHDLAFFVGNGASAMTIKNSSGNVGIGTTNPGTYKLNVAGTLNATGLYVNGTAVGGGSTPPTCTGANYALHWNGSAWSCDLSYCTAQTFGPYTSGTCGYLFSGSVYGTTTPTLIGNTSVFKAQYFNMQSTCTTTGWATPTCPPVE